MATVGLRIGPCLIADDCDVPVGHPNLGFAIRIEGDTADS